MSEAIAMELVGVRIELPTNTPILLLRETDGDRYLPIWIDAQQATAIALALEGVEPKRPMTHDLMLNAIRVLGAEIDRVVVTGLRDGTFYSDLILQRDGKELEISARPSDAIALAVRAETPLFAMRSVLDESGVEIRDEDEEQEIEKFREFLEEITPEDFSAGPQS